MMKTTTILFFALAGTLLFTSCKKESVPAPQPVPVVTKRLDQLSSPSWSKNIQFTYDEKGRLVESSNSLIDQRFTYVNNSFSATFSDPNHFVYAEVQQGVLDKAGRLVSFLWVYRSPNQPDKHATYEFTYDGEGHLVKSIRTSVETGDVSLDIYTWVNGNIMSYTDTYNGQPNIHIEYTYYDDLPNNIPIDLQDGIMNFYTDGLTGIRSKNLKKTKQVYNFQNVKVTDQLNTYDMTPDGFPTEIRMKDVNTNNEGILDLHYK